MILDKLEIDHFRAFPERTEVDLRAAVTVIYAANGTGKTSICDAVEWLLTGDVSRLAMDGRDLLPFANRLVSASDPSVCAHLRLGDSHYDWVRTGDENLFDRSRSRKLKSNAVIEELAKALPREQRPPTDPKGRERWLIGTRFLTASVLGQLLDRGDEDRKGRMALFAAVLGVEHFQTSLRKLDTLLSYLPSIKSLQREIDDKVASVQELATHLDAAHREAVDVSAIESRLADTLRDATEPLALAGLSSIPIDRVEELRALIDPAMAVANARAAQIKDLEDILASYAGTLEQLAAIEIEIERIQGGRPAASLAEQVAVLRLARETAQQRAKLGANLLARIGALIQRADPLGFNIDLDASWTGVAAFRSAVKKLAHLAGATEDVITWWSGVHDRAGALVSIHRSRWSLREELVILRSQILSADALSKLLTQRDEAASRLVVLRERFSQQATDRERLAALGRRLVEQHHDQSQCPLCGSDWGDHAKLGAALGNAEALASDAARSLDAMVVEGGALAEQLAERVKLQDQLRERTRRLEANLAQLEDEWRDEWQEILDRWSHPQSLPVMALVEPRPADEGQRIAVLESTAAILERLKEVFTTRGREVRRAEQALRTAEELQALCDEHDALVEEGTPLVASLTPIDRLEPVAWAAQLEAQRVAIEEARAAANREADRAGVELAPLEQVAREIDALMRQRDQMAQTMDHARARWAQTLNAEPLSTEALSAAKSSLHAHLNTLRTLEVLAIQAGAWSDALRRCRESARLASAVEQQKLELEAVRRRHARWERATRRIQTARDEISRAMNVTVDASLAGLTKVISAIYERAQTNRVFDRIDASVGLAGSIEWQARIDDHGFAPDVHFSLGQRQDLALAIFLARARTIGGSFLLDEPLSHLDELNRVGMIDVLRTIVIEPKSMVRFVITTSSERVVRQFIDKLGRVPWTGDMPALRVISLLGNARLGVRIEQSDSYGLKSTVAS